MRDAKKMKARGFTLTELLIVLTIITVLLALAVTYGKAWIDKYKAESQIRIMHADLMQARMQAMGKNMPATVEVNAANYRIGFTDDSGTTAWQAPKTLSYAVSSPTGSFIVDVRGIISAPSSTYTIQFDTGTVSPEYDCIILLPTRLNVGKMSGGNCVPR